MERRTTEQMIKNALDEGYSFAESGYGKQDSRLEYYRSEGYDVRGWYVPSDVENTKKFDLYIKKRGNRSLKVAVPNTIIDYSSLSAKELKDICKDKKITGYYKMSKSQMIKSLLK